MVWTLPLAERPWKHARTARRLRKGRWSLAVNGIECQSGAFVQPLETEAPKWIVRRTPWISQST